MQKLHHKAKEALDEYRRQHQEQTDALVALLGRIVMTGKQRPSHAATPDQLTP